MVKDLQSPHKTDHGDQTVSRRDLKLGGMVVLTLPTPSPRLAPISLTGRYNDQKYEIDKVNGGRLERNSLGLFATQTQRSVINFKEIGHWVAVPHFSRA